MTDKVFPAHKLMKLAETGRLVAEQNASRSGGYRDQIGDAVENYGLHKGAYGVASRAYKMLHNDELKGKEFITQAIIYLEMIRDNFRGHLGDFDEDAKAAKQAEVEAAGQAAAEEQVSSNVRALRGISKLKTQAGVAAE